MSHLVKFASNPDYDHVESHVRKLQKGRRENRFVLQARAADMLAQLSALGPMLGEEEVQQLQQRFPSIALGQVGMGGKPPMPPPAIKKPPQQSSPRLPTIDSPRHTQQPHGGGIKKSPRQQKRKGTRPARASHQLARSQRASDEAPSNFADVHDLLPADDAWLDDELGTYPPPVQYFDQALAAPAPVLSSGMPSATGLIGGRGTIGSVNDSAANQSLWESNPAVLAPPRLLRQQPVPSLIERRNQALDGLIGLLHSLARVRHAASRLPPLVARAYHERLQHAIGWYRITTCELVERIEFGRRQNEHGRPTLHKTPAGELRHIYPPYLVDGVNILLTIGRGDLAFAPLPAAGDPLLLLWFSTQVRGAPKAADCGARPELTPSAHPELTPSVGRALPAPAMRLRGCL